MPTLVLFLISIFLASPAQADTARDALAEMAKCADIADSSERLKCFDAAVPRAKNALAEPVQQAKDKGGILDWFGFSRGKPVTKPEDFGKPAQQPEAGEITGLTANVIEFAKTVRGKSVFILDNGQVWRQLDADITQVRDPRPDERMKVRIETGAMGSYDLMIEGRNGMIKVTRLR
jgi:hypothetical protein